MNPCLGGHIKGCVGVVMGNDAYISVRPVMPSDPPDKGRPWDGAFYRDQTETDAKGPETAPDRWAFTKPNDVHGHLAGGKGRPLWWPERLTWLSTRLVACHHKQPPPKIATTATALTGPFFGVARMSG